MRLLDTETGLFCWFEKPTDVAYAILSHVWKIQGEQSYEELLHIQQVPGTRQPLESLLDDARISDKIRRSCEIARGQGYRYLWIDTCCINKESSTELSEAINSMWEWYRLASVCYAFLADVDPDDDALAPGSQFRGSKWHTRGWTLQELIAPMYVVFLACDWSLFGTKGTLARVLEEVAGVDHAVLTHERPLYAVSVARRMWWASRRQTTRVEDAAYSLMGIFGINMPTIYGEGPRAFLRLQEEILRTIPDQSIFAW
ncbi:HET-domain-containing protein, partial [Trametes versicolor FP-101664 SS1]|uniref:HET-domain-containing protein n=1 Tax=Trametes versicolor (strain FP-101664) TaxID=717944 RepID=UPI0004622762